MFYLRGYLGVTSVSYYTLYLEIKKISYSKPPTTNGVISGPVGQLGHSVRKEEFDRPHL